MGYEKRANSNLILQDLDKKIILLSGPRQVGKTTLAKGLYHKSQIYLNYDRSEDRKIIREASWSRDQELLILDELHKMKSWKRWIKGIYDTEGVRPRLIVTGSARMDTYKKGGDSLAGRHFSHRLHPFSVKELGSNNAQADLQSLLRFGGFPEPLFRGEDVFASRWRRSHLDRILKEDLLDLEKVRDLKTIEILVDLLADRVGSPISYSSLAKDLEISPHTVKKWISILESLFVIFIVTPYSKNIAKAILKEPKIYFYDTSRVTASDGARLENLVATHLLKRNDFLEDSLGDKMTLNCIKNKSNHEVDFLITRNKKIEWLIEVKTGDDQFSKSLIYFSDRLKSENSVQVVQNLKQKRSIRSAGGIINMAHLHEWLAALEA